eukprot:TRINITY_DN3094_c0_g1_i1.p1 TRINITY_DN3094_c0_g1~~TRINITY_DN3094_c0_g1_i1.p1  ORF type:complete len:285 (+),score=33.91 TRINITY_DN3094_c0_g1_i1:30-857(+)
MDNHIHRNICDITNTDNTILLLPPEMLASIFAWLPLAELFVITKVCRLWHEVADSDLVWKPLCKTKNWPKSIGNSTYKRLFLRRVHTKSYCNFCAVKTTCNFPLLNITVCRQCKSTQSKLAIVNRMTAMRDYLLNDVDLSNLKFHLTRMYGRRSLVYLKSEVEKLCFEKYGGEQGFRVQLKQKEKQREKIKKKLESIKLIKNVDAIIHLLLHEDGELNMPLFLAIAELQNPLGIKKSEESLETISQLREKRKKSADNDDLHSVDPVRSLKRCKRE